MYERIVINENGKRVSEFVRRDEMEKTDEEIQIMVDKNSR